MTRLIVAILVMALSTFAADINVTGDWTATAEGPNGPMTRTFKFKVDGTKLTGESVSSIVGKSAIDNGHIEGNTLTFTMHIEFNGNEMTSKYKGQIINKDKIIFKIEGLQGGEVFEWVAKRVS